MQEINLQLADNGVIKNIKDDNINAAGESFESTVVYEFSSNENKIKFIEDLCIEVGLEFGNSKSKMQIQITEDWGKHYKPTSIETQEKIKALEREIKRLEKLNNG